MINLTYFKDEISKINTNKRIKIRLKPIKQNSEFRLYLDLANNSKHEYEYLTFSLLCTTQSKNQDKRNLKAVQEYRDQKELFLSKNISEFELVEIVKEINFYEYSDKLHCGKTKLPMYQGLEKHLKIYHGDSLKFSDIDKKFCENFKNYLLYDKKKRSLNSLTARTMMSAFKAIINRAIKDEIFSINPCKDISVKAQDSKREFLLEDELIKVANCNTLYTEVLNAFLFSCFTGLRLSDIRKLTFEEVKDGYLYFRQQKTGDIDRMLLTVDAQKIVSLQRKTHQKSNNVFHLQKNKFEIIKKLKTIMDSCGITKKITFHCARHTAACYWITKGIDIYTVQKLLGHREIQTTMIYAKLIDKKRDEYVLKVPELMK
jgi:integrase